MVHCFITHLTLTVSKDFRAHLWRDIENKSSGSYHLSVSITSKLPYTTFKMFHALTSTALDLNRRLLSYKTWPDTNPILCLVRFCSLTHWGRVTHICVSKLTIIGSNNGLSPGRRQAIIWTNDGILLIRPLGTNFSEILIGVQLFSFKKMDLKMSSAKWRPFVSASMS